MRSKVSNRELKGVDHFKCHGSVLTRDGYSTSKNKDGQGRIYQKIITIDNHAKHWTQEEIG